MADNFFLWSNGRILSAEEMLEMLEMRSLLCLLWLEREEVKEKRNKNPVRPVGHHVGHYWSFLSVISVKRGSSASAASSSSSSPAAACCPGRAACCGGCWAAAAAPADRLLSTCDTIIMPTTAMGMPKRWKNVWAGFSTNFFPVMVTTYTTHMATTRHTTSPNVSVEPCVKRDRE